MFIVKDDNPDVAFQITSPDVTDAEGNPIPGVKLNFAVTSDNADAVSVIPDAGDPNADPPIPPDPLKGSIHFGNPGLASLNVAVTDEGGTLAASFGAQFTVTVGDPAKIAGGKITFAGLTEVEG